MGSSSLAKGAIATISFETLSADIILTIERFAVNCRSNSLNRVLSVASSLLIFVRPQQNSNEIIQRSKLNKKTSLASVIRVSPCSLAVGKRSVYVSIDWLFDCILTNPFTELSGSWGSEAVSSGLLKVRFSIHNPLPFEQRRAVA